MQWTSKTCQETAHRTLDTLVWCFWSKPSPSPTEKYEGQGGSDRCMYGHRHTHTHTNVARRTQKSTNPAETSLRHSKIMYQTHVPQGIHHSIPHCHSPFPISWSFTCSLMSCRNSPRIWLKIISCPIRAFVWSPDRMAKWHHTIDLYAENTVLEKDANVTFLISRGIIR